MNDFQKLFLGVCLFLLALAIGTVLIIGPKVPVTGWKDTANYRPLDGEHIIGLYPIAGEHQCALLARDIVYIVSVDGAKVVEYWLEYDIEGGATIDHGRPYRWDRLRDIPDLLLDAMARHDGLLEIKSQ
jgi:hypothetical protein